AASFSNDTGSTVNSIEIRYDGEQWRNGGNTTAQTMVMQYRFGASFTTVGAWTNAGGAFNFTSLQNTATAGALDGNAAANRTATLAVVLNLGSSWPSGQKLWVRWIEVNDVGNDHGLALDNFKLIPTAAATTTALTNVSPLTVSQGSGVTFTGTVTAGSGSAT